MLSISSALDRLRTGQPIAAATETAYALAVDAFDADAVRYARDLKGEHGKPILLLIESAAWLHRLAANIPRSAFELAERHWPGQLTLVLRATHMVNSAVTAGTSTVGLRVPAHAELRSLIGALGHPITGTSFNRAGQPAATLPEHVASALPDVPAWNQCVTPGGPPSTVLDMTGPEPVVIRQGAVKLFQPTA